MFIHQPCVTTSDMYLLRSSVLLNTLQDNGVHYCHSGQSLEDLLGMYPVCMWSPDLEYWDTVHPCPDMQQHKWQEACRLCPGGLRNRDGHEHRDHLLQLALLWPEHQSAGKHTHRNRPQLTKTRPTNILSSGPVSDQNPIFELYYCFIIQWL